MCSCSFCQASEIVIRWVADQENSIILSMKNVLNNLNIRVRNVFMVLFNFCEEPCDNTSFVAWSIVY